MDIIERFRLWPALSPQERDFIEAEPTDPTLAQELKWRLESLWLLLWAIGDVDTLDWPAGECDVAWMVERMLVHEANDGFISQVRLRSKEEIIDACQLTLLVHWAIIESMLQNQPIPEDLDWTDVSSGVAASAHPAAGVVEQRHHALNWLTCFDNAAWDDVQTPT